MQVVCITIATGARVQTSVKDQLNAQYTPTMQILDNWPARSAMMQVLQNKVENEVDLAGLEHQDAVSEWAVPCSARIAGLISALHWLLFGVMKLLCQESKSKVIPWWVLWYIDDRIQRFYSNATAMSAMIIDDRVK